MDNDKPTYDFDFIAVSLGLTPIKDSDEAFNAGAVISVLRKADGGCVILLHGGHEIDLSAEEMADLESLIRARQEKMKAAQREAIKENIIAQAQAMQELQSGVQQGMIIPGVAKKMRN